ncbi:MAG: hypothetical protein RL728_916 [Bacteroidota bacterium]|jgi:hypothetical protein
MRMPMNTKPSNIPLVEREQSIQEICSTILDIANPPRQLERSFIIECVISSVAIYFNVDKQNIVNLKKRGQYSELRGICYYLLNKRHNPNFTYEVIAEYFKTYPSKICILHHKVIDRMKARLYNLDQNVCIIERNINAVIKLYEANIQNSISTCHQS